MLHGLFGDLDNFRSVSLHMERTMSIVRIDLPGHGKSPTLPSLSIESMADQLLNELAVLGIRQFSLLGHSLGGKVAMATAANPQCKGLNRLCVVDIAPKTYPAHHQSIFEALLQVDLEALTNRRDADNQLRAAIPDAGVRAFLLKGLYQHESKRFRWRFDLKQLAADYPLISMPPQMPKTVDVPTLFIKGSNSDYLTAPDETEIRSRFSDPSLKVIDGAGHWPHAEKPAQFSKICTDFFHT
ncbi:MAG: esterase [bacterium]|jgi:esterase